MVYAGELYRFLTEIHERASSLEKAEAVRWVDHARLDFSIPLTNGEEFRISLTSEFLGEAMLALRHILQDAPDVLTDKHTLQAEEYVQTIQREWFGG